jgi:uncharacterized protein
MSAIAVVIDATRILIYFIINLLEPQFYYYIPPLVIIGIVRYYIGKKIVTKITQDIFKKDYLLQSRLQAYY